MEHPIHTLATIPTIPTTPKIKSVFCSYRGILIVLDNNGNKIQDLCGEMTRVKYSQIEKLRTEDTEFDNLANYEKWANTNFRKLQVEKHLWQKAQIKAKVQTKATKALVIDDNGSVLFASESTREAVDFIKLNGITGTIRHQNY